MKNTKRMVLIIIAIVLALLLCWINFHVIGETFDFMHAGPAALIPFAIAIFLHAILLFIFIRTAIKLPLAKMAVVWGILIVLYLIPVVRMKYHDWKRDKEFAANNESERRLSRGEATITDFDRLYKNDEAEKIIAAFENGYGDIAKEMIDEVCDASPDRIFQNSESPYAVKVYGNDIARQILIRKLYYRLKGEELTEGVEYLLAKKSDVINMDYYEFLSLKMVAMDSKDDTFQFMLNSIRKFLTKRNLEFTMNIESCNHVTPKYIFVISSHQNMDITISKSSSELRESAIEIIREIREIRELEEEQYKHKYVYYSFRINGTIYQMTSTENISHVRLEIFNYLTNYYKVAAEDIVFH